MTLLFRDAEPADLPAIVAMLADDPLGATREDASLPLAASYLAAFDAIRTSRNQRLAVAVADGRVVGTLQLLTATTISHSGSKRGAIEGVRVSADQRGTGIGEHFVRWAVEQLRADGCSLVELASDATRLDAHRFWKRLGFTASHVGFKRKL